jgi:prophage antirepressor-like protein
MHIWEYTLRLTTNMELIQTTFKFALADKPVRMAGTSDNPWFCGKDIATILGYTDSVNALKKHVDIDDKTQLKSILGWCQNDTILKTSKIALNANYLKSTYVNESGLYSLILRSKLESAKKFKKWVTSEVLPSIRKNAQYKMNQEMKEMKVKIQEQNSLINNANIKNKELLTFKLMIQKTETVYIMSSKSYAKQGLWKIGRTKQKVTSRLASINTACPAGEAIHVLKEIKTHSSVELEKRCHWILRNLRPTYTREWFLSSWGRLTQLLDIIAENMDKEIDIVNELIKEVHSIDGSGETQYITGLDMGIFEPIPHEIIDLTHSTESTTSNQSIDITGLTPLQKKEKLIEAVNKFVRSHFEDMEKFDYNTDKDSDDVAIPLIWPNILINLMHICKIQKKTNIKANLWKPTMREMIAESSCLDAVKWR